MKILLAVILIALCFAFALAIGAQNEQVVTVHYLIAQGEFHLSAVMGATFAGGFLVGWVVCLIWYLRLKFQNRLLARKVNRQTKELEKLRALPVKDN